VSRLDLVVGPNGAGKTTFVALALTPELPGSAFVNADEIAARRCTS
jgi:predicted ABC-type ATPase